MINIVSMTRWFAGAEMPMKNTFTYELNNFVGEICFNVCSFPGDDDLRTSCWDIYECMICYWLSAVGTSACSLSPTTPTNGVSFCTWKWYSRVEHTRSPIKRVIVCNNRGICSLHAPPTRIHYEYMFGRCHFSTIDYIETDSRLPIPWWLVTCCCFDRKPL